MRSSEVITVISLILYRALQSIELELVVYENHPSQPERHARFLARPSESLVLSRTCHFVQQVAGGSSSRLSEPQFCSCLKYAKEPSVYYHLDLRYLAQLAKISKRTLLRIHLLPYLVILALTASYFGNIV